MTVCNRLFGVDKIENQQILSTLQCAQAILSRWGASEYTFKHIHDRHPFHYHPGFKTVDSDKQLITNPGIKSIEQEIKAIRKKLDKKHKKNSKAKEVLNKDGSRRDNSLKARLESGISQLIEPPKNVDSNLLNKQMLILRPTFFGVTVGEVRTNPDNFNLGDNLLDKHRV